jgi:hypothetical protein
MKKGKDIDGCYTPYPVEHRSVLKRILRKLYIKFVGDCYIPKPKKIELVRELQKIHPKYGKITHIVLHGQGYNVNGTYLFDQFGTEINEHKP